MQFLTRHYTTEDKDLIYNSFLKSFHKNYPYKFIPPTLYYKGQAEVIDFLMTRSNVLLAVFPEDATEVMGYIIYEYIAEALVIHYVYTKFLSRRKNVAAELINQVWDKKSLIIYTHHVEALTDTRKNLRHKIKGATLVYDPFLITNLRLQAQHGTV